MKNLAFMNEAVVERIKDKLEKMFHEYIDIRKLYEEELKLNHVYKEKIH